MKMGEMFQTSDWKTEKHVPVIECPDTVPRGEIFSIAATIGKEVAHPNKTEHHIAWIHLYFHPEGEKFPYQIGAFQFLAHGASVNGPDTSTVYTHHSVTCQMRTDKPGTIHAASYCNIHGLWESDRRISVL